MIEETKSNNSINSVRSSVVIVMQWFKLKKWARSYEYERNIVIVMIDFRDASVAEYHLSAHVEWFIVECSLTSNSDLYLRKNLHNLPDSDIARDQGLNNLSEAYWRHII